MSDTVLLSSGPPPIDAFLAGRVPGVAAGLALVAPGIVNLDEPPKLPFGVGSFFPPTAPLAGAAPTLLRSAPKFLTEDETTIDFLASLGV